MRDQSCHILTILILAGYFVIFSFLDIYEKDKTFSENEKRLLTQRPNIKIEEVQNKKYMNQVDEYLSDQFLLRDKWINLKTDFLIWSGQREIKDIVFVNPDTLIKKYYSWNFDKSVLEKKADNFVKEARKIRSVVNGNIMIMMVPGADEIYAEEVGKSGYEFYGDTFTDMLKQRLLKDNIKFIPVKEALLSNKNNQIYYRTDHHWTSEGAFYGYQAFCDEIFHQKRDKSDYMITQITDSFLGTLHSQLNIKVKPDVIEIWTNKKPITYSIEFPYDNNRKDHSFYNMTYLDKKDKYSVFLSGNHPLIIIQNETITMDKTLLVIKDSYANCMLPFLLKDYKTIYVIDKRYNKREISEYAKEIGVLDVLYLYQTMQYLESF